MPTVPNIIHLREKSRSISKRNPAGKAGLACSTLLSLGMVVVSLLLIYGYSWLIQDLPSPKNMPILLEPPDGILLQPTRIYDQSGEHLLISLENPAGADWKYTTFSEDHPLVLATIASTDADFWRHSGFSLKGLQNGEHSTLAQRLVVDFLLGNEKAGLRRNLRERLLAAQITTIYGKKKILEWYLNKAKYGLWTYGADAAARAYFNKKASDLNLAEAALLAAIAEAPELNPVDAPANIALEKQKQILQVMMEQGLITPEAAFNAKQAVLNIRQKVEQQPNPAPAFIGMVLDQIGARFGKERLERGGLRVVTSLDYGLQVQVNCAIAEHLRQLSGLSEDGTSTDCQASRLLPTLPLQTDIYSGSLSASLIVIDPHTGYILALAGDTANPALTHPLTSHPSGSLITPFIYLTAFTRGLSPASLVWDIPSSLPATLEGDEALQMDFHGPVRLRTAFANDYLTPAVQLLGTVGPNNVERTIQQLGVSTITSVDLQSALSQSPLLAGLEINLFEAVQAYAILANQGIQVGQLPESSSTGNHSVNLQPVMVLKVETINGEVWMDCSGRSVNCSPQVRPVVSPQLTYLMINVLSDETTRWPSLGHPNPLEIGRPAGAKIGASGNGNDGWTVGFTPQLVVGAWTGKVDQNSTLPLPDIAKYGAARLWHAIIQYASRDLPPLNWTMPPGINSLEVCDPSGMLPTPNCPTVVNEVFLSGNEPTQYDNLYQVFQLNRETGRLATVFTPPELIEEQVFMVLPPEAIGWGKSAHIPKPPTDYDVIFASTSIIPGVSVDLPLMFAHVKGKTVIRGSANGEGFSFYRLQVGKGLNPHEWIQIGQDSSKPVENGLLGEWDTSGLSGLYAIQLLVVRKDRKVDTATIQITVDNQPPVVTIVSPVDGQIFEKSKYNTVILQASTSDNLGIQLVEFYIDRQLIANLYQAPFLLSWEAKPGEHTFQVKVYDLAGNISETSVTFKVNK